MTSLTCTLTCFSPHGSAVETSTSTSAPSATADGERHPRELPRRRAEREQRQELAVLAQPAEPEEDGEQEAHRQRHDEQMRAQVQDEPDEVPGRHRRAEQHLGPPEELHHEQQQEEERHPEQERDQQLAQQIAGEQGELGPPHGRGPSPRAPMSRRSCIPSKPMRLTAP